DVLSRRLVRLEGDMDVPVAALGTTPSEAERQIALRHLAMMIARDEPYAAVLSAVTGEALRQFGPASAGVLRYEPDGRTAIVAESTHDASAPGWASSLPSGLTGTVLHTGRFASASEGSRVTAAAPVHVDDLLWGLVTIAFERAALPPDSEQRLAELAELVEAAVTNEQHRAEL